MPHPANDDLYTSQTGIALIERFEGFEPDWYRDPVGIRTIAFGWTGELPIGFDPPLTEPEGRDLLRRTIKTYERAVRELVDVPLAQGAFDALVSFTYNLGRGSLATSTLLKKLNGGDPGVGAEFDRWVFAGGQRLAGLVRRRAAERAMYESATPSDLVRPSAPQPPRLPQPPSVPRPPLPDSSPPQPPRQPEPPPGPRASPPRRRFWWLPTLRPRGPKFPE